MKKNDCFEMVITDTGIGGEGIGHYDGMAFFVKDAVIGDRLRVRVTKLKKNYGYGRVEEIIDPSVFRVEPKCPVAGPCGGCQIQQMDYEKQLAWKQRLVRQRLFRIGGISEERLDEIMAPILGNEDDRGFFSSYHYRNKAQYPVSRDAEGNTVIGFYASHSHRIVETAHCMIGHPVFDQIVEVVRNSHAVIAYDEHTGGGLLRHLLLRRGANSGQIMVCFVVNTKGPVSGSEKMVRSLTEEIRARVPGDFVSFCVNYNPDRGNVILGKRTETFLGKPYIEDEMNGIRFHISAPSFYQVNTRQAQRLYQKAIEYAALTGEETVWDLYCGIGTLTLTLAQKAARVYGVEVVPEAVENARENAQINGMDNVEFILGKAEDVLPDFYRTHRDGRTDSGQAAHPDVIVVDPPRKGCDEKCLETMADMKPDRIVYVSCDPATLARDVCCLCGRGYALTAVTVVDQFCHSVHVETVVQLVNIGAKPDYTVRVDVDVDEMYKTIGEDKRNYIHSDEYKKIQESWEKKK